MYLVLTRTKIRFQNKDTHFAETAKDRGSIPGEVQGLFSKLRSEPFSSNLRHWISIGRLGSLQGENGRPARRSRAPTRWRHWSTSPEFKNFRCRPPKTKPGTPKCRGASRELTRGFCLDQRGLGKARDGSGLGLVSARSRLGGCSSKGCFTSRRWEK